MTADTESQLRQECALRGQEEGEPCEEVTAINAAAAAQPLRRRWRPVVVGTSGLLGAALVLAALVRDVGPSATTTLASRALQASPALAAPPAPSAKADVGVNLAANDTNSVFNSFKDCSVEEEAECKETDGCEWDDDASKCKANQTGNGGGGGHAVSHASITSQALNASITSQVCIGPGTTMDYFKRWWTPNRNNWRGEVGFKFTVGGQDICVVALGRALTARGQKLRAGTTVRLWDASSRQALTQVYPGDNVHVAPFDEYAMVELPHPVTLRAHTEYTLSQSCTNGMDNWVDTTPTITANEAETRYITVGQGVYSHTAGYPAITDGQGRRAGMLQIRFSVPTVPTCTCNHRGVQNSIPPGRSSARFFCWLTVDTGCQLLTGQTVYWSWANCFHNGVDQIDCTQKPVCELHPHCRAAGLYGDCCPNAAGISLACCKQADCPTGYHQIGSVGDDIGGWGLSVPGNTASSISECTSQCDDMESCDVAQYVMFGVNKHQCALHGYGSQINGQYTGNILCRKEADMYSMHDGYIPSGGTILTEAGWRSVEGAKSRCSRMPSCKGFTYRGRFTEFVNVYFKDKWALYGTGSGWTSYKREQNPNPAVWCYDDTGRIPTSVVQYSGSDHGCSSRHGQCHWPSQNAAATWSTSDVDDYAKDKCSAWSECQALYCTGRHNDGIYVCYARKSNTWSTEAGSKGFMKVRCQSPSCDPTGLSDLSSDLAMRSAGWEIFNVGAAAGLDAQCGDAPWYGWAAHDHVGTLRATLRGSGWAFVRFGNCWDAGNANMYVDGVRKGSASPKTKKSWYFKYTDGTTLELRDEDGNAVMQLFEVNLCLEDATPGPFMNCNIPYEYKVDYPGNDLAHAENIHSARRCAALCSSFNIPFFTYGHAFPHYGECWCKTAQRNRLSGHQRDHLTSGGSCAADWACPDFEVNRNYPYNDIPVNGRSPTSGISSALACAKHCGEYHASFFTHHHHSRDCYCKGRQEYGRYEDYFTSGQTCQKEE